MERSKFEIYVLHSITLSHSAEFTLVELLKTAKKHEIHVNNIQREREVFTSKEHLGVSIKDQPVGAL
jgi:hypothetical protein